MNQLPFLLELKNHFSPDNWRVLLLALRQDSLLWETLEKTDLGKQALKVLPPLPEKWNPARLSLLIKIDSDVENILTLLDDLCSYPTPLLDEPWKEVTSQAFKDFNNDPKTPPTLVDSGLCALAIREQHRIKKDWQDVFGDFDVDSIGKTTLSCLYGMVSESQELLQYFLQTGEGFFRPDIVLHILLSNPLAEESLNTNINVLSSNLDHRRKLSLLRELAAYRPWVAAEIAHAFLGEKTSQPVISSQPLSTFIEKKNSTEADYQNLEQQFKKLEDSLDLAQWYQVAAEPDHALPILSETLYSILRLRGHISAHLAQTVTQSMDSGIIGMDESAQENQLKAWRQAVQLVPDSEIYASSLAQALLREGNIEEAQSIIENQLPNNRQEEGEGQLEHPAISLTSSLMAFQLGDREGGRQAAIDALESLDNGNELQKPEYIALIRIFLNENMHQEVALTSKHALEKFPVDHDLLSLLAESQIKLGKPKEALSNAYTALAISQGSFYPKNPSGSSSISQNNDGLLTSSANKPDDEIRKLVIDSLEAIGGWQAALDERKTLMDSTASPTSDDLHAFMYCAIQAEQPKQAIQVGRDLLEIDTEDIEAHQRIAEASLMLGDYQTSIDHFEKGIHLAPAKPSSWLGLVKAYRLAGEEKKATNTLRAACQALPDNPEIHLTLGEINLEKGELTQALSSFRQAASLSSGRNGIIEDTSPASERIALRLGQALYKLGHLEEARQVLSRVFENTCGNNNDAESLAGYPSIGNNLELAKAFACTLLGLEELSQAIPMLTEVVRLQPDEPEPTMNLARALLKVEDQPDGAKRAIPLLQRILGINPDGSEGGYYERLATSPDLRAEARSLLAEAYTKVGNWQQSFDAYRKALDEPLNREPEQQSRLSLGMGLVALKLEQPEMAVAALEEAAQTLPLDASVQRALSEAYLACGLPRDAFQSAKNVLDSKPEDIDTLLWFADLGSRIISEPAAAQLPVEEAVMMALSTASQLNPDRPDLQFRLGEISQKVGNNSMAIEVLRKLTCAKEIAEWLSPGELFRVAKALIELGDAQLAISFLEKWIEDYKETFQTEAEADHQLADLYQELSSAYQMTGDLQAALQAVEQALPIEETRVELHLHKADLLVKLHQLEAARECLEKAFELFPSDITVHYKLAQVLKMLGELTSALSHMEQIMKSKDKPLELSTRQPLLLSAAELAFTMLRPRKAIRFLKEMLSQTELLQNEFHCVSVYAELALEMGDLALASQKAELLEKISPNHPGSQGIIARLCALQGDRDKGVQIYHSAARLLPEIISTQGLLEDLNNEPVQNNSREKPIQEDYFFSLLSVSLAALEFRQWEDALSLLRQLIELAPYSPIAHMKLAQTLILRAEAQSLYQDLEVLEHAVGESALDENSQRLFESSIHEAERHALGDENEFDEEKELNDDECKLALVLWLARGKAIFQPNEDTIQSFRRILFETSPTPEAIAALISIVRKSSENDKSIKIDEDQLQTTLDVEKTCLHPLVQMQLSLAESDSHEALNITKEALENSKTSNISWPETPMFYFLIARLAKIEGVLSQALEAIQKALDIWPDEARWHFLASQLYQNTDEAFGLPDPTKALLHLEQAARLEPENAENHLALGLVYLENSQFQRSAKAFEKATLLDPHQSDTWLLLARAQRSTGDLEGAGNSAEHAIEGMTDPTEALLLRGEISLQAKNPRGALSRAQTILRSQKDNPTALYLLARSMEALDRPKEALEALEKTIQLQGSPLSLQLERLQLLRRLRGVDTALKELGILIANEPEQPDFTALMAEWLWEADKHEEAIQIARQALQESDSGLSMSHKGNLHYIIGKQMHQIGQLDQAIHHLSEAIENSSEELDFYLELGKVYQDRRENRQALKVYQKAINIAGNDYRPFYQAGVVLKDNKDYLASESMLRRAAQLAPNEVSVHRLLGAVVALNLVHSHRLAAIEK